MEQPIERNLHELICGVFLRYLKDENMANDSCLSKITIRIVGNIFNEIRSLRPDLEEKNKQNKEEIEKCCGYTLPIGDDSLTLLLNETLFADSGQRNLIWIEVLCHETTHAFDLINNKGIMGHDSFDSMLCCAPFWYWTEFHARYKGTLHMLSYVKNLPEEFKTQYENEIFNTTDNVADILVSNSTAEIKRYKLMHLLGDIAAYSDAGFSIPSEKVNGIFPDFKGFIEFLKSKDRTVDPDFLTIVNLHLKRVT